MALAEAAWKRDTVRTERPAKLTVFTLWMTHLEIASPYVDSPSAFIVDPKAKLLLLPSH